MLIIWLNIGSCEVKEDESEPSTYGAAPALHETTQGVTKPCLESSNDLTSNLIAGPMAAQHPSLGGSLQNTGHEANWKIQLYIECTSSMRNIVLEVPHLQTPTAKPNMFCLSRKRPLIQLHGLWCL